jgi:hypothetical protein
MEKLDDVFTKYADASLYDQKDQALLQAIQCLILVLSHINKNSKILNAQIETDYCTIDKNTNIGSIMISISGNVDNERIYAAPVLSFNHSAPFTFTMQTHPSKSDMTISLSPGDTNYQQNLERISTSIVATAGAYIGKKKAQKELSQWIKQQVNHLSPKS